MFESWKIWEKFGQVWQDEKWKKVDLVLSLHCKKYNTSSTWFWERPPKHWERKPAQNTTIWKQNSFGSSHLFIGSKENDILSFLECFPKNWNNAIVNRLDLNTLVSIPYEFIVSPKHWDWQIKEPWF